MKNCYVKGNEILERIIELNPYNDIRYNKSDDLSNGRLFADVFQNVARYNTSTKSWFVFDGRIWKNDEENMIVEQLAQKLKDALLVYSMKYDTDSNYQVAVAKLGNRRMRSPMIQDARNFNFINNSLLDNRTDLFNIRNGILNLKTLEVSEHDSSLLMSKIANVTFNADADCPDFLKFIDEIMMGDKEKIRYLQKIFGYSLTAETSEEQLYMLYGESTRNGKSTLLDVITSMMGDYAINMNPESLALMKKDSRNANDDIARLDGRRFVQISEPQKRMLFDVALVKTLTGRDVITARHLHERFFDFVPQFKMVINTNHLPLVNDSTLFTSGRIKVVTFDRHFEEHEQDRGLKNRLKRSESLSGILNWCIDGLRMYREEGLIPPESVRKATEDYQLKSDKIGAFIDDCLVPDKDGVIKIKDVYTVYDDWCRENGYGVENKGNFIDELKTRGLYRARAKINGESCKNVIKGYLIDGITVNEMNPHSPFSVGKFT